MAKEEEETRKVSSAFNMKVFTVLSLTCYTVKSKKPQAIVSEQKTDSSLRQSDTTNTFLFQPYSIREEIGT